jgi:hypothetical protein
VTDTLNTLTGFGADLAQLRRPFAPAAVKVKLQSGGGTKDNPMQGLCVFYIDARLAAERLNAVVGLDWHDEYEPVPGGMLCRLTVRGVTRIDVGEAGSGPQGNTPKALVSDALKRAAVKFGVGVSIYATPTLWTPKDTIRFNANTGKASGLANGADKALRQQYASWLTNHGVHAFGDVLDHGDVEDAQGDVEVEGIEVDGPSVKNPASTPKPVDDTRIVSEPQRQRLNAMIGRVPWLMEDRERVHRMLRWATKGATDSTTGITRAMYDHVCEIVRRMDEGGDEAVGKAAAIIDEWHDDHPTGTREER